MPLLQSAVKLVIKPLPDVINPRTHFVLDYVTAGAFLASSAFMWRVNKRASIGAALCGATEIALASLTTRPGSRPRPISFRTHGRLDLGLAAMTGMMPEFMGLEDAPQSKLFMAQGILITAIRELTNFDVEGAEHSFENIHEKRQIA
jgi:hypothetical protein